MNSGLVVTRHGASAEVLAEDGTIWSCHQRKSKHPVVAGDKVLWQQGQDNKGIIIERLPRKNILSQRKDHKRVKEIAANLDQVVIAFTVKPRFDQVLIDRYIAVAEQQGIHPVLLMTKLDIIENGGADEIEAVANIYRAIGYPVVASSQKREAGLDALRDILKNKISVLVGQSGVGKSSLATMLLPGVTIETAGLTARGDQGSHTTSSTTLYPLPFGGYLVDSPGVRDFSVWDLEADKLADCYIEFLQYTDSCRFSNCRHINEPDCAVKSAVARKEISEARYNSYASLYRALTEGL